MQQRYFLRSEGTIVVETPEGYTVVTTVGDPGADTKLPTEQAVREALTVLAAMAPADGWIAAGETWVYASADDPTYTFTISGDKTSKYYAGMRVKLTQTTGGTKYAIITKTEYSSPNTTITAYFGTDYDLANEAISSPYYSMVKAPAGFPLDPTKWTVTTTGTSSCGQSNPTANTWYDTNLDLVVPIGAWMVGHQAFVDASRDSSGWAQVYTTLSTTTNTETHQQFTVKQGVYTDSGVKALANYIEKNRHLTVTSKTTFNYLYGTQQSGQSSISVSGEQNPTVLYAICAYL